jgi:hypothetical protein
MESLQSSTKTSNLNDADEEMHREITEGKNEKDSRSENLQARPPQRWAERWNGNKLNSRKTQILRNIHKPQRLVFSIKIQQNHNWSVEVTVVPPSFDWKLN